MVSYLILFLLGVIFQEALGGNQDALTQHAANSTSLGSQKLAVDSATANDTSLKLSTRSLSKRYTSYNLKLTWPQALLFCRRRKKQLATISNEDDHHAVRVEVQRLAKSWEAANNNKFWVGAGMEGSDWIWATTGKQLQYVVWANGQPKPRMFCLQVNAKDNFNFVSGKCEEKFMFICQS